MNTKGHNPSNILQDGEKGEYLVLLLPAHNFLQLKVPQIAISHELRSVHHHQLFGIQAMNKL